MSEIQKPPSVTTETPKKSFLERQNDRDRERYEKNKSYSELITGGTWNKDTHTYSIFNPTTNIGKDYMLIFMGDGYVSGNTEKIYTGYYKRDVDQNGQVVKKEEYLNAETGEYSEEPNPIRKALKNIVEDVTQQMTSGRIVERKMDDGTIEYDLDLTHNDHSLIEVALNPVFG